MPAEATRSLDWPKLLETALTAPGSVGNTYNRFYTYSFLNQMYLLMQGVCEPVATYKRWQSLGRQVVKGAKAAEIVRPINIKRERDDGEEVRITRFKPVKCLFGYSQTIGEELLAVEPPGWDLDTAHQRLDVRRVPYQLLDGNTQGYSLGREYAINPVAVHPVKTTFHEIGHIILGHTTEDQLEDYQQHRGVREFQAESTAYLTTHELGVLDETAASVSRGYVQGWLRDQRPPDPAIRQVFTATDTILKAGRPATIGEENV
jgi:antirestriction protein ArdC